MKIFLITNFPAPYRIPLFDEVAQLPGVELIVFYSDKAVDGHKWIIPELRHNHRLFSDDCNAFAEAAKFNPDVLIIAGFNRHTLPLFALKLKNNLKISIFTDMWDLPFANLSPAGKKLRKFIYAQADHFIVPGLKSVSHVETILGRGFAENRIAVIPLTPNPDNFPFNSTSMAEKDFDLIFSGQIIERKLPGFFAEVCAKVNEKRNVKILILGSGPLQDQLANKLTGRNVKYLFAGYVPQEELHSYYKRGKLLLFPTEYDTWGIVATEALSASVPVIISPAAGAADDLVISGKNGFVLENNADLWAEKTLEILDGKHQFTFDPPPSIESIARKLINSLQELR